MLLLQPRRRVSSLVLVSALFNARPAALLIRKSLVIKLISDIEGRSSNDRVCCDPGPFGAARPRPSQVLFQRPTINLQRNFRGWRPPARSKACVALEYTLPLKGPLRLAYPLRSPSLLGIEICIGDIASATSKDSGGCPLRQ